MDWNSELLIKAQGLGFQIHEFLKAFRELWAKRPRAVKQMAVQFFILLICAGRALSAAQPELLPDGSLRPGTRITIRAGERREILFQPEGVRFLSGRARITSVGKPFVGPEGEEIQEFVIDVAKSPGIPWMHNEKPFRLRIHAETDFTLEARQSWEWTPEDDYLPSELRSPIGSDSRTFMLKNHRTCCGSNVPEPVDRQRASHFPTD